MAGDDHQLVPSRSGDTDLLTAFDVHDAQSQVRTGLPTGGRRIRTAGPTYAQRDQCRDEAPGNARPNDAGSHLTLCWREMDSNFRFPDRKRRFPLRKGETGDGEHKRRLEPRPQRIRRFGYLGNRNLELPRRSLPPKVGHFSLSEARRVVGCGIGRRTWTPACRRAGPLDRLRRAR